MATKKMALIVTKGTLDMAYPPFILASTAAALDYEVQIFFTFYGLQLLRKDLSAVNVSLLDNPTLSMPTLAKILPGMESMATLMMKNKLKEKGVASLEELRDACLESGVKFVACQMTVDLFDLKPSELIDAAAPGGAATFLEFAGEADISLFI